MAAIFVGTAAWTVPKASAAAFPGEGTHLQRYAGRLNAVEINSSFHRPHQRKTYERWAASTPAGFRFSVKVPKAITHQAKLEDPEAPLEAFLEQCEGLGPKLGALLVQLPPKLAFSRTADIFFSRLRDLYSGHVAFEPRHGSFFTPHIDQLLRHYRIARVAADPPRDPSDGVPGGDTRFTYARYHGAPRIYYSDYPPEQLAAIADTLKQPGPAVERWCIFDNTALGHGTANALEVSNSCTAPENRA